MDFDGSTFLRKQRREGILLALVGAMFVGLCVLVIVIGNAWMGTIGIAFFGACAVVGVAQAVRPGQDLPASVAIVGSLGFAAAGALLIIGHVAEISFLGHRQAMALPVGVVTLGSFGSGAVLLIVREVRRRRRNR